MEWNRLVIECTNSTSELSDRRKLKFTDPIVYRPFRIAVLLIFLQQLSGIYVSIGYVFEIFKGFRSSGDTEYRNEAFIIFGLIRFIVSILYGFLSARFGRKTLLITSSIGMLFCCLLIVCIKFATFLNAVHELISILSFILYMGMGNIGVASIPIMFSTELLPTEVRSVGSTVILSCGFLLCAGMTKYLPYVLKSFGTTWLFSVFGLASAMIIVCTHFLVPETFGRSLGEIERFFQKK